MKETFCVTGDAAYNKHCNCKNETLLLWPFMAGRGFDDWSRGMSIRIMTMLQAGQMGNRDLNSSSVEAVSGAHKMDRRFFPWE